MFFFALNKVLVTFQDISRYFDIFRGQRKGALRINRLI